MGDRACILVRDGSKDRGVYLYTHWGGSDLPGVLANALDRGRDRWNDAPYLARIIFCDMVGEDTQGTTGFGIQTYEPGDVGHKTLIVDTEDQTVQRGARGKRIRFQTFIDSETGG